MKIQLQPIETAPTVKKLLLYWMDENTIPEVGYQDNCGQWFLRCDKPARKPTHYAELPDCELPPKPKTVIEEVEGLIMVHYAESWSSETVLRKVLDILRKRKGEVIE